MTTTFSLDIDEIVKQAYQRIGGEPMTGQNARDARINLNLLFIDMANRGSPLAKVEQKTKTLTSGTATLTLDQEDVDVLELVITTSDDVDIEVPRIARAEYLRIPNKTQESRPTQYSIDRQKDQIVLTFWPVPDDAYSVTYYSVVRFEDVTGAREDPDINVRYLPSLITGLAWYLSFNDKDFPLDKRDRLEKRFEEELERARVEDSEKTTLYLQPYNYRGY